MKSVPALDVRRGALSRWAGTGAWVLSVGLLTELLSYSGLRYVVDPRWPGLFYQPPRAAAVESALESYLAWRHPVLGWPGKAAMFQPPRDRTGARLSPAFPAPGNACVSLYGDSFAWAEEVSDGEAWGNLLSARLNCRVANYGGSGYGTDQAYLRFLHNSQDEAGVAVLVIYPDDLSRNVNRYRALLSGSRGDGLYGFKPRFTLTQSGHLILQPILPGPAAALARAAADPSSNLRDEYYLPNSIDGPRLMTFPYTVSLLRSVFDPRLRQRIKMRASGEPEWRPMLRPGHDSQAFEITVAIAVAFDQEARRRGRSAVVVFVPALDSMEAFRENGRWPEQQLAGEIERRGVAVEMAGDFLHRATAGRPFRDLLTRGGAGHFTPEGNRLLAAFAHEVLKPKVSRQVQIVK